MRTKTKRTTFFVAIIASLASFGSLSAQTLQDAILYTQSEQFENANKAFQSLTTQQPQNGTNYFYYGDYCIRQYMADTLATSLKNAASSASKQFEKGQSVEPSNPLNLIGLAEVALFQKDITKAQSLFAQAQELLPSKKNKVKMPKEQQATAYIKIADAYVKSNTNDTTAIFAALRQAEKLNSKDFEIYLVQGDAYIYMLNDGSGAINSYNIAYKLNPKSAAAQLKIGQLWKRAKNYDSALAAYKQVVQIDATYAPAYKELGFLYARLGNTTEAKNNFKQFLDLSSGNTDAQMQYINTLFQLQDYNEVANQAQSLLNNNQTNVDLYRALGYADFEIGKPDGAITALDSFFKKAPADKVRAMDYNYYARSLSSLKKDSIAGDYYMKAYAADTAHYDYLNQAAVCYNNAGSYTKAINAFQQKIKTGYYKLSDLYYLGTAYQNLKQYDNAVAQYSAIIEKSPDYIQAYLLKARCLSKEDPDSKSGIALPAYQALLDKTETNAAKYAGERGEAYSYLNFYYFMQYMANKSKEDAHKAIDYGKKALEINPNNQNAKVINENLEKNLNRPAAQPK